MKIKLLTFLFICCIAKICLAQTGANPFPPLPTNPNCLTSQNLLYRTYDGTCNNLEDPLMGAAGSFYSRGPEGAEFADKVSIPVSYPARPYERVVSNAIARNDPNEVDIIPHTLFSTQFGQFVNHDLDNNRFQDAANPADFPIGLVINELNDEFCYAFVSCCAPFNPYPENLTMLNFCLPPYNQVPTSTDKNSSGSIVDGTYQIYNNATAWLELSQVYAPSAGWNSLLRSYTGGLFLTTDYDGATIDPSQFGLGTFSYGLYGFHLLTNYSVHDAPPPLSQTGAPVDGLLTPAAGVDPTRVFTSGDERIGENIALTTFHTLFIRNHNYWARILAASNPTWNDEKLFQEARRRNIAEYQNVVLYEYVPNEFGQYFFDLYVGEYDGYDIDLEHYTPILFASAAFRYGHSSFRNYVPLDHCGHPTLFDQPAPPGVPLFGAGETGGFIATLDITGEAGTFENLIRGLVSSRSQPNDVQIDDVLRSLPFEIFVGGSDLLGDDMIRGRINGIPNWNTLRKNYYPGPFPNIYGNPGCPASLEHKSSETDPLSCFFVFTSNVSLAHSLQQLYGKVNKIDALIGLLAEEHVPTTSFGPTLGRLIVQNYADARNADRFWFENRYQANAFSQRDIETFQETTMAALLKRNFDLPHPPANPFKYSAPPTC